VTKASPLVFRRKPTGAELMRAVLSNVLEQVLANASGLAEGGLEADRVHQLRVGLRRLRTALRELAFLCEGIDAAWEPELQRVFAALGRQRDSVAAADAVGPLLAEAGAPKIRWDPPAPPDAVALVRDAAFQQVLVALVALAHADDAAFHALEPGPLRRRVADALDRLHQRVLKAGRRFDALPAEQQHRVRKRLKRLRYLAEFSHGLWPRRQGERFLEQLQPAQDTLGRHADCRVAMEQFRVDAAHDPRSWFAAGFLQDHLALTARDARRVLKRLQRVRRFWA
jgi:CHAD domain-containing protein